MSLAIGGSACGSTPNVTASIAGQTPVASVESSPDATDSPQAGTVGPSPSSAGPSPAAGPVRAIELALHLPAGLSRTVVAVDGATLLVLGGLTATGTSDVILRIDPVAGEVTTAGRLASAVHDAAGALLGRSWLVFGGGRTLAVATVQELTLSGPTVTASLSGSLPVIRADHAAVSVGDAVVIAGGGHGGVADASILSTTDGRTFRAIGTLRVAVRYAADAIVGGRMYLFGGSTASGDTEDIQVIDPVTGRVEIVGKLPRTLSGAAAFVLAGRILIAGGIHAGRAVESILAFDPTTGQTSIAGTLPAARAYAGVALIGDAAFLVGGEAAGSLDTVVEITAG